jgi:site-specific recombinase XerD
MVIHVIYQSIQQGFERWLKTLDYADSTVYLSVRYARDFFFYLSSMEVNTPEQIQPSDILSYYKHLQSRGNKRQTGSLSDNSIAGNINAIKRLSRYLHQTGRQSFEVPIKVSTDKNTSKIILTRGEILSLYKACENSFLGIRDRAILSLYYGCGLRRSEGIFLDVKDVQLKEKLVFVRKGKNYRQRYVPMTGSVREDLESYIYTAREQVRGEKKINPEALLVSSQGKRMSGTQVIGRVHHLAEMARISKLVGLHTLRHSIASHLLHSGMTLEEVSQFLGHSSLESTQIYTHISAEMTEDPQDE